MPDESRVILERRNRTQTKAVNFRLPLDKWEVLRKYAYELDTTPSSIIRYLVEVGIEKDLVKDDKREEALRELI